MNTLGYKITLALILPLLLFSCASMKNEKTPISDDEYTQLLQFARTVIKGMPANKLSTSDKRIIFKTQPDKIITYTGYKQGKAILNWKFDNGKQVKFVAEGDIMDFPSSFKSINIFDVSVSSGYQRQ